MGNKIVRIVAFIIAIAAVVISGYTDYNVRATAAFNKGYNQGYADYDAQLPNNPPVSSGLFKYDFRDGYVAGYTDNAKAHAMTRLMLAYPTWDLAIRMVPNKVYRLYSALHPNDTYILCYAENGKYVGVIDNGSAWTFSHLANGRIYIKFYQITAWVSQNQVLGGQLVTP